MLLYLLSSLFCKDSITFASRQCPLESLHINQRALPLRSKCNWSCHFESQGKEISAYWFLNVKKGVLFQTKAPLFQTFVPRYSKLSLWSENSIKLTLFCVQHGQHRAGCGDASMMGLSLWSENSIKLTLFCVQHGQHTAGCRDAP